jgi:hypothetical protein
VFSQCGPSSRHFTSILPTFPCCHMSLIHPSSLVQVASLSVHHPLIACHASPSFHISLSPEGKAVSPVFTPIIRHVPRAGPWVRPSNYSVSPGGSTRSLPYPEELSWTGRYQSQEAVMKWLVVVRHRLRHNGNVLHRIKSTSISPNKLSEY